MDFFNYKNGELYCEDVPAERIAREVGTPAYVYSKATLLHHYRQVAEAFKPLNATICYSIKSCGNINICKVLAAEGCGFDVTSGGELFRALQAGGDPKKIIYAGVGKTDQEIADAINAGIAAFNIESEAEIENIDRVAGSIGQEGRRGDPHQSRRRPQDPRQDDHRQEGDEVRRRHRAGRARLRAVPQPEEPAHRRRAPAHRLAGVRDPAVRRRGDQGHRPDRPADGAGPQDRMARPRRRVRASTTSGRTRRCRSPSTPRRCCRCCKASRTGSRWSRGGTSSGNAGHPADAGAVPQDRRGEEVRHRRRGDERPDPPDAVRELPLHLAGQARRRRTCPAERDEDVVPADGETVDVVGPICESGDYLAKDRPLPPTQARRPAGGLHRRGVRLRDEQQLQQPPARCRRCWWTAIATK